MPLKNVLLNVKNSDAPLSEEIHLGNNFLVTAIGLNPEMKTVKLKSNLPSKILILKGEIQYKDFDGMKLLELYDEHTVPVDKEYNLRANEESIALIIKGY